MDVTDKPTKVRQGEELDLKVIEPFLKDNIPGLSGELLVEAVSERVFQPHLSHPGRRHRACAEAAALRQEGQDRP